MLAADWAETWARIKTLFAIMAPVFGVAMLVGVITDPSEPGFSTAKHVILGLVAAVVLAIWVGDLRFRSSQEAGFQAGVCSLTS